MNNQIKPNQQSTRNGKLNSISANNQWKTKRNALQNDQQTKSNVNQKPDSLARSLALILHGYTYISISLYSYISIHKLLYMIYKRVRRIRIAYFT